MLLSAACKRLKASPVDQVCGKLGVSAPSGGISLAESAPSGGVHHTRRAPTPAASLTDELDAFDTVLAQLVSGEMPFSLDIIDMSAEVTVLLLQQAWRQWRQEPVAKSSQSLTRAARVCAAIASREQCRPPLLAHGGLPALTCMLRGRWEGDAAPGVAPGRPTVSPTSMAVVEAASQAVCLLSIVEDFPPFVRAAEGTPDVLVRLLAASAATAHKAARTIKNAAVHEGFCAAIVQAGAVLALAEASKAHREDADVCEQVARALGNIALHEQNEGVIISCGGVEVLLSLLGHNTPHQIAMMTPRQLSMADAAVSALGNLAESPQMREALVSLGGVAQLLQMARSAQLDAADPADPDGFSQRAGVGGGGADSAGAGGGAGAEGDGGGCREGGGAGAALGTAADREALLRAQPPPPSADQLRARMRGQVGWILVSLAADPALCGAVVSEGGVGAIFLHAQGGDETCEEEAAWALACLAGEQSHAAAIAGAGALPLLLKLAGSPNPSVRLQALWALSNLAVVDDVKQALQALGAVPALVRLLDELLRVADGSPTEALRQVLARSLSQVTRCIANLLVRADCREALLQADGLPVLLRAYPSSEALAASGESEESDPSAVMAVARALANLTFDGKMVGFAVRAGALPQLVRMLSSDSAPLQREALWSVQNISAAAASAAKEATDGGGAGDGSGLGESHEYEKEMTRCGVLEPLVALLHRDEEPGLQEQASLALANIASRESTKLLILRLNVLDILFRLSRSASRQVAEASRRVLDVLGGSLSPASRRVVGAVGAPSTSCRNKQFHRRGSPLAADGAGASRSSLSPLGAMADAAGVELD